MWEVCCGPTTKPLQRCSTQAVGEVYLDVKFRNKVTYIHVCRKHLGEYIEGALRPDNEQDFRHDECQNLLREFGHLYNILCEELALASFTDRIQEEGSDGVRSRNRRVLCDSLEGPLLFDDRALRQCCALV